MKDILHETDFNLNRESYNKFFGISIDPLESGMHLLLKKAFPIICKQKKTKITYEGITIDYNAFHDEVYYNKYLTYAAKIKLKLKIHYQGSSFDHVINISSIPIMIQNKYFMINGTKKIMIYQFTKTGGIYYSTENSKMISVRLVSLSGSRIELKLNQRETIDIYVNNSKKIVIADFFKLIDNDKILRYIAEKSGPKELALAKKTQNLIIKYVLLYSRIMSIRIDNIAVWVQCTEKEFEDYLMAKWNKGSYDKKTSTAKIPIQDVYIFILINKKPISFTYKKDKEHSLEPGSILVSSTIKKLEHMVGSIETEALFFLKKHDSIARSFVKSIDKDYISHEEPAEASATEATTEEETEDEEEETSEYVEEFDEDEGLQDSANIEYVIDSVIRERINKYLNISYSKGINEKITEEDIIELISFFSAAVGKNVEAKNYDFLSYKTIKRPEEYVFNIIIRKINRLNSNIKYITVDRSGKSNIDEYMNSYNISNEIKKLFNSHPLVQFLDQTNPLAELSHRRRIAIFNLTNIEKYQISFDGRDINPTYFGRMCPNETPEGPNIGLINSAAILTRINDYGFLMAPYYVVKNGEITDEIVYLYAEQDFESKVATYRDIISDKKQVMCRWKYDIYHENRKKIQYADVAHCSVFSVSSCLIPGIQHNDARRSLMGSNMQRQAIPLTNRDSPVIGTCIEKYVPEVNSNIGRANFDGVVVYVSSSFVLIEDEAGIKRQLLYLEDYVKTNMKTCNRSIAMVYQGDKVTKGQIIVDGYCSENGELALGQNVLLAFLSWYGYEFEDSIVISSRLKRDGIFESIYMNEVDVRAKEIDLSVSEKITKDNPNDSIRNALHLDDRGVVKVGTTIKPCKILVSRVMPVENDLLPEDYIISVIFNKKISDYRDISYRTAYDIAGVVIRVKYFNRHNNQDFKEFEPIVTKANKIRTVLIVNTIAKVEEHMKWQENKEWKQFVNKYSDLVKNKYEVVLEKLLMDFKALPKETAMFVQNTINLCQEVYNENIKPITLNRHFNVDNNIIEYVKISIAHRRVISIGDKLSGRHGNKGVVSYIAPMEDMPFMDDGTIVDVLLSPTGIPNRLNIGQILEVYFGAISFEMRRKLEVMIRTEDSAKSKELIDKYLATKINRVEKTHEEIIKRTKDKRYLKLSAPVFDSLSFEEIKEVLRKIDAPDSGKYRLRCGINGEAFNRRVQVGIKYLMKLNHMAVDKLSARETGGYSTILQQPLPRKANYGGQRFGEMEAWAVEAYGVAALLKELLGPKSDDRESRNMMYEEIFVRKYRYVSFLCETVNVITRYLNGACIGLKFKKIITA